MEASSAPIPMLGSHQGRLSSDGAPQGDWTTVRKGRRQRRKAAGHVLLAASDFEGSSSGCATPAEDEQPQDLLSSSLPSPQKASSLPQPGLLAQAVERAGSTPLTSPRKVASPHQLASPRQPVRAGSNASAKGSSTSSPAAASRPAQQPGQAAAAPAAPGPGSVALSLQDSLVDRQEGLAMPREESLSQSALDLHSLGKAPLRSSKSDIASLTISTARQHDGGGLGGLEGIPESARGGGGGGGAGSAAAAGQVGAAATPMGAAPPLRRGVAAGPHQPFAAYLVAELHPGPSYPTPDVVWGQTERDRVYNALVSVPYQLERFLLFGVALCLDSFLAIFTLLPLRVGVALLAVGRSLLAHAKASGGWSGGGESGGRAAGSEPAADRVQRWQVPLRGDQLFDLLVAAMSLGVVLFLWNLNAGTLYFWMKDLTQELLKLSVLYTALELSDKICCSFGVDVMEALAASCTQLAAAWDRRAAYNVACDVLVASLLLLLHGATLMSQAMVFGVAMNSKKNTLVALLIAANFTEIKGTVLKRFDATKLYTLACQDVVERFHLLLVLAFVVVEEMGNSGSRAPNPTLLAGCARIYAGEMVIDIIKHAVLGKFNEIRPGVYREFMRDLCDRVSGAQSHNIHKLVGFEPFAPAALFFRIALTAAALRHDGGLAALRPLQAAAVAASAVGLWALLLLAKLGLGYVLKLVAISYVAHYEARRASGRMPLRRATAQQQAAAKKEE